MYRDTRLTFVVIGAESTTTRTEDVTFIYEANTSKMYTIETTVLTLMTITSTPESHHCLCIGNFWHTSTRTLVTIAHANHCTALLLSLLSVMGSSARLWNDCRLEAMQSLHHPWTLGLARGYTSRTSFKGYVAQDANFLRAFAKVKTDARVAPIQFLLLVILLCIQLQLYPYIPFNFLLFVVSGLHSAPTFSLHPNV